MVGFVSWLVGGGGGIYILLYRSCMYSIIILKNMLVSLCISGGRERERERERELKLELEN